MQEGTGGVVVDAVVEHSGDDVDLLGSRAVVVLLAPDGARRDLGDDGLCAVVAFPQQLDRDTGERFFYRTSSPDTHVYPGALGPNCVMSPSTVLILSATGFGAVPISRGPDSDQDSV